MFRLANSSIISDDADEADDDEADDDEADEADDDEADEADDDDDDEVIDDVLEHREPAPVLTIIDRDIDKDRHKVSNSPHSVVVQLVTFLLPSIYISIYLYIIPYTIES